MHMLRAISEFKSEIESEWTLVGEFLVQHAKCPATFG